MNHKKIVRVPPTVEPISREEANNQLRLELGDDDDHVQTLISAARDTAENYCNRFFTEQTIAIVYDSAFSGKTFCLPYPDLQSIVSITTYDEDGAATVLPNTDYNFNADQQRIYFNTVPTNYESFTVEVLTGPPAEFESAKQGMLMILTDLYENRTESVVQFTVNENPAVRNMLYPYRVNLGV